tara:strand:- start:232 stop:513 length:282 start_codon:yes stop_codon:yes gene_type:complete
MSKEEERQDFVCNDSGKGFHMKFTNGNIVSVQWNGHNYSNGSDEAEVAAWDRKGRWHKFPEGNSVKGWVRSDEVAEFIQWVASNELNIEEKKR